MPANAATDKNAGHRAPAPASNPLSRSSQAVRGPGPFRIQTLGQAMSARSGCRSLRCPVLVNLAGPSLDGDRFISTMPCLSKDHRTRVRPRAEIGARFTLRLEFPRIRRRHLDRQLEALAAAQDVQIDGLPGLHVA